MKALHGNFQTKLRNVISLGSHLDLTVYSSGPGGFMGYGERCDIVP